MSLISNHVRDYTNNRNTFIDTVETRFKELEARILQTLNTDNSFVTKQEMDELIQDLKDCFSNILETPRDVTNISVRLNEINDNLNKMNKELDLRLKALEESQIVAPEANIRVPKLKIEKSRKI